MAPASVTLFHVSWPNFFRLTWRGIRCSRGSIDDIFAIQNRRKFDAVKNLFEEEMDKIKVGAIRFTIERQVDNKIPFLNVMCEIVDGRIQVDIYRKPTHTMRLITGDSFHDIRHKMAAYHSMANYMFSLPRTDDKIEKETRKIVEIGQVNGFKESAMLKIVDEHRKKSFLNEISTFYVEPPEVPKRISVRYLLPESDEIVKVGLQKFQHRNGTSQRRIT